jgi:asparagine synthase (glutamine-hydrolysing)
VDASSRHAAVVLGDAILAGDAGRADARSTATSWSGDGARRATYDGFHIAAVLAEDGRVIVGGDVLGLFPIYYAALGEVLLVGASPEPFRWHPAFQPAVSLEGLLTVLMLGGPFHGPCLLRNVRRLAMGRLLEWRPGESPRELEHCGLPTEHRHAALSFDDQVDLLYHAYERAVRRHQPPKERQGILLSGGRDSRLLAGCLAAQGSCVDALTLGLPTDHEVACAKRVARALRFAHHVAEVRCDEFVEYATRSARWEHLAAGMATIHTWGAIGPSRMLPSRSGNGYFRESREVSLMPREFGDALRHLTRRFIHPELLHSLVRGAEGHDIIDALVARLEASYNATSDDPAEAGWRLDLQCYDRYYTGGIPWRLSFGSWPVMAVLDREFLDAWIGIPIARLADRRLMEATLSRRFPRLARLPLDRNAHYTRPIAPSLAYRAREWLSFRMPRSARRQDASLGERRHYYRQYDFDNPGWRAIRRAAEPHRARLAEQFDLAAVNRIVPAPDESGNFPDPMAGGFAAKTLLGLMLWMHEHGGS